MKRSRLFRACIAALTCTGMMSAQLAQAASPQSARPAVTRPAIATIQDISLQEGGVLRGTVVDSNGVASANAPVAVTRQGEVVARTETNANGEFAVGQLTGGVYEVQTPASTGVYRLWAPRTAPPAAADMAVLTPNTGVVRGQMGGGSPFGWLANPWVLAGIVAAAIAIPLALDDDDAS